MNYNKINNLVGWLIAALSTLIYVATADQFNSWWDTGEFIASAYKLQIVHQPGAPLFLMIQNLFSNFAGGNVTQIAHWMNIGSAVCSGLTVLFLYWTITALARKLLAKAPQEERLWTIVQIQLAGVVGAGAYAFTDSFWYSAVESEVYAMSSLCTAVVFWLALKWERRADEPTAERWLLLIMYVMGLSIGVHLLNLLTIPAIALIVYFRKRRFVTWKGVAGALGIGIAILGFVLWGVIQYVVRMAAQFDLFFVNQLGLGFGSGVLFFALLLLAGLVGGLLYSIKRNKPLLNTVLLGASLVLFGYSSFAMIVIRAHADPPLNNNAPDNVYSFLGYLSREQYASEPLLKGPVFDAKAIDVTYGTIYKKGDHRYEKLSGTPTYEYDKEMLFPRMYSDKHQAYYRVYMGLEEGETPSFMDNVRFFFSYQLGDMYGRYFMWNFAGRQNDEQRFAGTTKGNWLSGVRPVDEVRLGGQTELPTSFRVNPSRNVYYYLPLLIGVLGLLWHMRKDRKSAVTVALLFFFTGIAIVLYLNQTPMQPRERDYAYAGSFYTFSIWIGFGALALIDLFRRKLAVPPATIIAGVLCIAGAPWLLISENWADHDRSDRDFARQVAFNYLNSCEPDAILFTYADNDTFPLWYLQEVEGVRKDIRIVNLSYLLSHWYVKQLKNKVNDAPSVDTGIDERKLAQGVRDYLPFIDQGIMDSVDVDMLMEFLLSDNQTNQVQMQDGSFINYLPAKKWKLKVDKQAVISKNLVPQQWHAALTDEMQWEYDQNFITRAELALLGIIQHNQWKRPIYFTNYAPEDKMAGLSKYLIDEGLVKRLVPVSLSNTPGSEPLINLEKLYENAVHTFQWGNYAKQAFVDVDSRNYMTNFVVPQVYERTARLLKEEGEIAKAKEVAIVAAHLLPKHVYDAAETYLYGEIVDTLYRVGEGTLANRIVNRHLQFLDDQLTYTQALLRDKPQSVDTRAIQYSLAALDRYQLIVEHGDRELYAQVEQLYSRYRSQFVSSEQE